MGSTETSKLPTNSMISDFKSDFLSNGVARPSRYEVRMSGPAGGYDGLPDAFDGDAWFHADSVVLPSRECVTIPEQWHGPTFTIPIGEKYPSSVVISFLVDDYWSQRQWFEAWMDQVSLTDAMGSSKINKWMMSIDVLDGTTNPDGGDASSGTFKFDYVYPSSIMPIQLASAARNDYVRQVVSFEYRDYYFTAV